MNHPRPDAIKKVELELCNTGATAHIHVQESAFLKLETIARAEGKTVAQYLHDSVMQQVQKTHEERNAYGVMPLQCCISAPLQPIAMPYSPARRYGAPADGMRDRLRQMVAVKRQIELELIDFAERELMR